MTGSSLTLAQHRSADQPSSHEHPSIAIVGLGRVGTVLGRALHAAGYRIVAVASRDGAKAERIAAQLGTRATDTDAAIAAADLALLAISDDALAPFAADMARAGAWKAGSYVVHVSGASPASVLQPAAECGAIIGALHPLAAFASPDESLPPGLTFGIEAPPPLDRLLHELAITLGGHVLRLRAEDKTLYHAAAVITSNYAVTLAAMAAHIFEHVGATPESALQALLPLMRTTLRNLEQQGLPDALTGPLVRGDIGTIQQHLASLDRTLPQVGALYRCLARATLPLAQERGLDQDAVGALQDLISLPTDVIMERGSS